MEVKMIPLGKHRLAWKDNNKMDPKEIHWEWFHLAVNRNRC
jgi:hypothetical protein